jgi:hypothetical protein
MNERTSADINQEREQVNKERARLVTEKPDGWRDEYAKLQEQITELARQYSAARQREEMEQWWNE